VGGRYRERKRWRRREWECGGALMAEWKSRWGAGRPGTEPGCGGLRGRGEEGDGRR
jgi:hypothetical protein